MTEILSNKVIKTVFGEGAMPFETIAGLPGKVYVPERQPAEAKKHHCRDCHTCQMCSEDRCNVCRGEGARKRKNRIAGCMPAKHREDASSNADKTPVR